MTVDMYMWQLAVLSVGVSNCIQFLWCAGV